MRLSYALSTISLAVAILFSSGQIASANGWSLPWPAGITTKVNGGWHSDGYLQTNTSLDFNLPAKTPVLAPIDSTVIRMCDAGGNHRAIYLQSADGQKYSLIHVAVSDPKRTTYNKGDQIGEVASNSPVNTACARWSGAHLHMGLPSQSFVLDGYKFSPSLIPSPLISQNTSIQDIGATLLPIFDLLLSN